MVSRFYLHTSCFPKKRKGSPFFTRGGCCKTRPPLMAALQNFAGGAQCQHFGRAGRCHGRNVGAAACRDCWPLRGRVLRCGGVAGGRVSSRAAAYVLPCGRHGGPVQGRLSGAGLCPGRRVRRRCKAALPRAGCPRSQGLPQPGTGNYELPRAIAHSSLVTPFGLPCGRHGGRPVTRHSSLVTLLSPALQVRVDRVVVVVGRAAS